MDINQCQHGEPYVEKLSTSSGHEELGHEENYELFCRRLKYVVAVFIIFAFSFFHRAGAPSQGHWSMDTKQELTRSEENDKEMLRSFGKITPNESLEWHLCFDKFQCARLTVPMDYHRPLSTSADNPRVHLALMMLPGISHTSASGYSASPLLVNPGGPGGSGVGLVQTQGPQLRHIVGEGQDIIGFDPRGIGETTPQTDCFSFPSSPEATEPSIEDISQGAFHRSRWSLSGAEIGLINSSDVALKKLDSRVRSLGSLCKMKDNLQSEDSILRHVATSNVARDMLSIIDAWVAWTEKSKDISSRSNVDLNLDTRGKLVYWGFSYGTLLGATFAAMYPDRVGRIVLDGVVDADQYVSPIWFQSIRDADDVLATFFKFCHQAGKECTFYYDGDTENDIRLRYLHVLEELQDNAITMIQPRTHYPESITYSAIKSLVFFCLKAPVSLFPLIARLLDSLFRHDEGTLAEIVYTPAVFLDYSLFCDADLGEAFPKGGEATYAISCSDKRYPLNETIPKLSSIFNELSNLSTFADVWLTILLGCDGWNINATEPPMRWDNHPAHKGRPINTSFPLLFISNTADPVTPLASGLKMARNFGGAGLVEQRSEGHCSISTVSKCTIDKIREYLTEGKVPRPPGDEEGGWEVCERDEWPWRPFDKMEFLRANAAAGGIVQAGELMAQADRMQASKDLQEAALDWTFLGQSGLGLKLRAGSRG